MNFPQSIQRLSMSANPPHNSQTWVNSLLLCMCMFSLPIILLSTADAQRLPAPTIFEVDPPEGSVLGDTLIFIFGENFDPETTGTVVEIGGVPAVDVIVESERVISAFTPPAEAPGAVDVVVINPDGQVGRLPEGFTYIIDAGDIVVDAGPDQTTDEGTRFVVSARFTALGGGLRFTASVDWGDGTTDSSTVNQIGGGGSISATHVYPESGEYTVTVTVTDDLEQSGSDQIVVTVNNLPANVDAGEMQFIFQENPVATLNVSLTDPGTLDTHTAEIDWGDGATERVEQATGPLLISHTYSTTVAVYDVIVTVTDDDGASSSDTVQIAVENTPPTVSAGADVTANEGERVTVTASFTDPGVTDNHFARIDWGDGSPPETLNLESIAGRGEVVAEHVYQDNGVYEVAITIADQYEGRETVTSTAAIANVAPTVNAGDAQTLTRANPTLTLNATFIDPGALDTHTALIDWGDGQTDSVEAAISPIVASHTYDVGAVEGYTVTVTVTDDDGGVGSDSFEVTVVETAPRVEAQGPERANEGEVVAVVASFTADVPDESYTAAVDWGDGTVDAVPIAEDTLTASHTYGDDGVYRVTVTVTSGAGVSGSDALTTSVANVAPTISPIEAQSVAQGEALRIDVRFADAGVLDTHTVQLDWGDGTPITTVDATTDAGGGVVSVNHVYSTAGAYTATVTVNDDDAGSASASFTVTVVSVAVVVDAGEDRVVNEGNPVVNLAATFNAPSGVDVSYTASIAWGDGESQVVDPATSPINLTHTYPADDGNYLVTVTVTGSNGSSGLDTVNVTVSNVNPVVVAGDDLSVGVGNPLVNLSATFTDVSPLDTHTARIDWGDGTTATVESAETPLTATHTYPARAGVYTVVVTVVDDDGGEGSDSFAVTVRSAAPVVQAGADQTLDEGNPTVSLNATFTGAQDTYTALIDWGDGETQSVRTAVSPIAARHTYPRDDGQYTVTITVTNSGGVSSSDSLIVTVQNLPPVVDAGADETVDADTPTVRLNATFSDAGEADTHSVTIDWGDGRQQTIDLAISPILQSHTYSREARAYTVRITVVDDDGGSASDTLTVTVRDQTPPEVAEVNPRQDEPFVAVTSPIEITFSEPLAAEVGNNAIRVTGANNRRIAGQVALDAARLALTFTPEAPFRDEEPITVVITTAVRDVAGNALASQVSVNFTTGLGVWPGDANNDGRVSITDILPLGQYWNLRGNRREAGNTAWQVQPVSPWTSEKPATYADTNGDGVVNAEDVMPIAENWGNARTLAAPHIDESTLRDTANLGIYEAMYAALANAPVETDGVTVLRRVISELIADLKQALAPVENRLLQNFPNPFNPETWIPYQLAEAASVRITIYDTSGRLVRTLDVGHRPTGYYTSKGQAAYWDGRNTDGERVTSSVYFYRLEAGTFESVRKLIVVK